MINRNELIDATATHLNPDWFGERSLLSERKSYITLQIRRSDILPHIGISDTGRQFLTFRLSSFL